MHPLTEMIKTDMKPALGVTESGAIAFAAAKARSYLTAPVDMVQVIMNSGMYKNAYTCGIPNSTHFGAVYAAALGAIAGNAELELEALRDITPHDNEAASALIKDGKASVKVSEISSRIYICALVRAGGREAVVTIQDSHTNIVRIFVDGKVLFDCNEKKAVDSKDDAEIHRYTLSQLLDYVKNVDISELSFLHEAFSINLDLFEEGYGSDRLTFLPGLLAENGGLIYSKNSQKTAQLLCNGAIEARVLGLSRPAMSVCGSGAHGIIATLPLYAATKVEGYTDKSLLQATALSLLICRYIKEYSGKLSAYCGCAIAAGTGVACGLAFLRGGDLSTMDAVIRNMAASITGMICDGGNQGCTMKGIVAVDVAFQAVELALHGINISTVHGICAETPEETMRNMGRIASPGMVDTEKTIIDILQEKEKLGGIIHGSSKETY